MWKPRPTGIAILLGLGVPLNVAVAWLVADHGHLTSRRDVPAVTEREQRWWSRHAPAGYARAAPHDVIHSRGLGIRRRWILARAETAGGNATLCGVTLECGWPLRSLQCQSWGVWDWEPGATLPRSVIRDGIWVDEATVPLLVDGTLVPFRPMWAGAVAGSLFYAALLWLLGAGALAARGRLRRLRGCCPRCRYPIGSSAVCSECGCPLAPRPAP